MNKKQKQQLLERIGYPTDPLLSALQDKVGDLAADWRGAKTDRLVKQYHAVLKCLIALDWDGYLDADEELPVELMPPEYAEYLKRRFPAAETAPELKGNA